MKRTAAAILAGLGLLLGAGPALADGELHIFNWGDYTNPELIKKFEAEHNVKVTLDAYDSNDTMLAKVKAGGSGYDIVVPSDYMIKIMVEEDLLLKTEPNKMSNFEHMKGEFVDVYWDSGRHYSVPWQWGSTGISVNTDHYDVGQEPNDKWSWAVVFDAPDSLKGKINMVSEMTDVIAAGLFYLGHPQCNGDKAQLKELNDLLQNARQNWRTMEYDTLEKLTSKDAYASHNWNGYSMRARQQVPSIVYVYPKEGLLGWMDNVAVLKEAKNVENAKLFQNFIMDPQNAAMISNFARYANGVAGSEKFMDAEMISAPEINAPDGTATPTFVPPCPREVTQLYTKIWNNLLK